MQSRFLGGVGLFAIEMIANDIGDGYIKMFGKGKVTLITTGHGHDSPGTITGQYIFGDPDRYLPAIEWINCIGTRKTTGDLFHFRLAFPVTPAFYIVQVLINSFFLFRRCYFGYQFMFGCHYHKINTKNGIGSRGINREFFRMAFYLEIHFCPLGFADPVALHFFHAVAEINRLQSFQQTICIGRNAQIPLPHFLFLHRETASFTYAIHHFIVRQHRAQCFAPVHFTIFAESQAAVHQDALLLCFIKSFPFLCCKDDGRWTMDHGLTPFCFKFLYQFSYRFCLVLFFIIVTVEQLQKDPLRPFVIVRVAGLHFAAPVVAKADIIQLRFERSDILLRGFCRVLACIKCILLGRQTKTVEAHRVQHIESFQSFIAAVNIRSDITQRVAHMQPGPAWIREHIEHIILGLAEIIGHFIGVGCFPFFLPFLFNIPELVFHAPNP